jgi:hypothetical protein
MIQSETAISIERSPDDVFRFLTDIPNFKTWRQGNLNARQISDGALGVGSIFREDFWLIKPFRGKAIYKVTGYDPGKLWSFATTQSPVKADQSMKMEPVDGGTRLTLITEVQMHPKFLESMFRGAAQRDIENTANTIKRHLEAKT